MFPDKSLSLEALLFMAKGVREEEGWKNCHRGGLVLLPLSLPTDELVVATEAGESMDSAVTRINWGDVKTLMYFFPEASASLRRA